MNEFAKQEERYARKRTWLDKLAKARREARRANPSDPYEQSRAFRAANEKLKTSTKIKYVGYIEC